MYAIVLFAEVPTDDSEVVAGIVPSSGGVVPGAPVFEKEVEVVKEDSLLPIPECDHDNNEYFDPIKQTCLVKGESSAFGFGFGFGLDFGEKEEGEYPIGEKDAGEGKLSKDKETGGESQSKSKCKVKAKSDAGGGKRAGPAPVEPAEE